MWFLIKNLNYKFLIDKFKGDLISPLNKFFIPPNFVLIVSLIKVF